MKKQILTLSPSDCSGSKNIEKVIWTGKISFYQALLNLTLICLAFWQWLTTLSFSLAPENFVKNRSVPIFHIISLNILNFFLKVLRFMSYFLYSVILGFNLLFRKIKFVSVKFNIRECYLSSSRATTELSFSTDTLKRIFLFEAG